MERTTETIVCLGDSTTAGTPLFKSPIEAPPHGEGNKKSQPAYWLGRAHPEWQVLNRGVNGERSDQIAARFDRDVLAHSPKVVTIIAGVNDVYQGREAASVIEQLKFMYDRARMVRICIVAGTILPYNTATAAQNAQMHAVNAWIMEQGFHRNGFVGVDTRAAVAADGNPDLLESSEDGLHPDINGYRMLARALDPAIAFHFGRPLR